MPKSQYIFRFKPILTLILLFLLSACNQKSGVKDQNGCKYLANFKNDEWSGKITEKFIDQTLDNSGVIRIVNDNGIHEISDVFLSDSKNYKHIKIGDSIVKIKNELIVHLYNSNGKNILETDFDCDTSTNNQ